MSTAMESAMIQVCVRFKPSQSPQPPQPDASSTSYGVTGTTLTVNREEEKMSKKEIWRETKLYNFDCVFEGQSNDDRVYDSIAPNLLSSIRRNESATLILYGQTGSGKTYTMRQVMQRLLQELYQLAQSTFVQAELSVGAAQVYLDAVYDLLSASPQKPRGVPLDKVTRSIPTQPASSADEAIAMVVRAEGYRAKAPHNLNQLSSRSHSIVTVVIRHQRGEVKLYLVDLAGSERSLKAKTSGEQLKEGTAVNNSLFALGKCMTAMGAGHPHIPFRETTLTMFLAECFSGGSLTLLCTVTPDGDSVSETKNTLAFADFAKKVRLGRTDVRRPLVNDERHQDRMQIQQRLSELERYVSDVHAKYAADKIRWQEDFTLLEGQYHEMASQLSTREAELEVENGYLMAMLSETHTMLSEIHGQYHEMAEAALRGQSSRASQG